MEAGRVGEEVDAEEEDRYRGAERVGVHVGVGSRESGTEARIGRGRVFRKELTEWLSGGGLSGRRRGKQLEEDEA